MKRKRMTSVVVASSATVFQFGIPIAGYDAFVFDPQAFFADNTCNFFNCDTLFFLRNDHNGDEHDDTNGTGGEHDDSESGESDNHTHK